MRTGFLAILALIVSSNSSFAVSDFDDLSTMREGSQINTIHTFFFEASIDRIWLERTGRIEPRDLRNYKMACAYVTGRGPGEMRAFNQRDYYTARNPQKSVDRGLVYYTIELLAKTTGRPAIEYIQCFSRTGSMTIGQFRMVTPHLGRLTTYE